MLSGKQIILGITGGIAAYKAAFLLREFQKSGAEVRVTMTPAATQFIGEKTFASLSKNDVAVKIFPEKNTKANPWTRHIEWGEWADIFVVAPCTANSLAKIAHGLSDNMLTATILAARCPVLVCPTMDGEMYTAASVKENIATLRSHGIHILEPAKGYLASGLEGRGRLPETEQIIKKSEAILTNKKRILSGKKVVVTAGPTREHIDPVRFLSNPSSGKMGFAMAQAAKELGADVTLLHGTVSLDIPQGIETKEFTDTKELEKLVTKNADADVIIMAAAVSDFTPSQKHQQKIKKENGFNEITLQPTTDILAKIGATKKTDQTIIGFAMETQNLLENAAKKRRQKNIDWIVANSLTQKDAGFASDTNTVHLIGEKKKKKFSASKKSVADAVLDYIFKATD